MKHLVVHYKNKYPGCHVDYSEDKLDVHGGDGMLVSLRKNGYGLIVDMSSENGAVDKHDLNPIPKNARVFKLYEDGRIGKSEEAEEREKAIKSIHVNGKILSIAEYKAQKDLYDVSDKGEVTKKVKAQPVQEPVAPVVPTEV
ncbi:MAG: hypothetical protein ACK41T_01110 [Pseudobdellovibrio sp.]